MPPSSSGERSYELTGHVEPPADEQAFLDWAFERALELIEDDREAEAEQLLLMRPSRHDQVREQVELARRVAFAPTARQPKLGDYVILQELGHGGMGTVWLARQQRLGGRLVALKVLPPSMVCSPRLRARFRAEAQVIARLRHPHVVDVYDVIQERGVHAYAMEWIEGSTLAKVIDRVRRDKPARQTLDDSMQRVHEELRGSAGGDAERVQNRPSTGATAALPDRSYIVFICRTGAAIARALGAVHRAGLVHRDVKPSNILLRRDGTALLSDFGLAHDSEATLVSQPEIAGGGGEFAGTAAYAAPEQLRADGEEVDGRADVYALGATLYAALALRVPFDGSSHIDVLRQIQLGLAMPLRRINRRLPRDLQTIVARAMELDPARRYQTADEMADDLDRLLALQPIRARPASLITRSVKLARRSRRTMAAASIGGVLVLCLVAVMLTALLGFPRWSSAHLDEARLMLLDPEQSNVLFSALFWEMEGAGVQPVSPAQLDRALRSYDAALRFAPLDEEIAGERRIAQLARAISSGEAAALSSMLPRFADLPLTAALAECVATSDGAPCAPFPAPLLERATAEDLRSLGLLAFLCGRPAHVLAAWSELDLRQGADPMVETVFGIAYLITEQPGRAYPRLRGAVEAFPEVGFLTVHLAEAAMRCGDLAKAQQWLDAARTMPRLDRFNGLDRVQAGLHVAAGREDEACRLYEQLLAERSNVVAFCEYAQLLERRGELERAVSVHLLVLSHGSEIRDVRRRFVDVVERWWQGLGRDERAAVIEAGEHPTDAADDRSWVLYRYVESLEILGEALPADGLPRGFD